MCQAKARHDPAGQKLMTVAQIHRARINQRKVVSAVVIQHYPVFVVWLQDADDRFLEIAARGFPGKSLPCCSLMA
jgi:hypothetical protein